MSPKIHAFSAYHELKNASFENPGEPTEVWVAKRQEAYRSVRQLLLPFAASGDPYFQFALAEVLGLELALAPELISTSDAALSTISSWWQKAAAQGHVEAVEHLLGLGVGEEPERLQALAEAMESEGLTVAEDFMTQLTLRAYGVALPELRPEEITLNPKPFPSNLRASAES